jgi:hypothetical protein
MDFIESDLGQEYLKFCRLRNNSLKTGKMDLSIINWFYPTSLLPLGIFIKRNQYLSIVPPADLSVLYYYNIITKGEWLHSPERSYIPIVQIPHNEHQREKIFEPLYGIESDSIGGLNAFSYFIGELVDNICQHSSFLDAYILAQKYETKKFIEVGIIDNGISIPGVFENAGFEFNDTKALFEAINGQSTKSDVERGFGLKSSLKLLTKGLHGECLIVSRRGGLIATEEEKTLYNMDKDHEFSGTLICVRVPYTSKDVNIYDYIE